MLHCHIIETVEVTCVLFCKGSNLFIRTLYPLFNCLLKSLPTDTIRLCSYWALTVIFGGYHLVQRSSNSCNGDITLSSFSALTYIVSSPETHLSAFKHFVSWWSEMKISERWSEGFRVCLQDSMESWTHTTTLSTLLQWTHSTVWLL